MGQMGNRRRKQLNATDDLPFDINDLDRMMALFLYDNYMLYLETVQWRNCRWKNLAD